MITIKLEGKEHLATQFKITEESLQRKSLLKAMRPGVRDMSKAVKGRAPKDKGILRRAVTIKPLKGRAKDPSAGYYVTFRKIYPHKGGTTTPYYALFVHNGTIVTQGKRKHRKPKLYSRSEERAYMRERLANGSVRIKANPFVWDAFESQAESVGDKIITDILTLISNG